MPITQKQLDRQYEHVGASKIATICGVNPYPPTITELWMEYTGKIEPDDQSSNAMHYGTLLEPVVLRWYELHTGQKVTRANSERRIKDTPILVHRDATAANDEPVEAKTTGINNPPWGIWGEQDTDDVPQQYLVQCMTHIAASSADVCHLPVLIGGRGFKLYRVHRDQKMIDWIIAKVLVFWHCVQKDIPPFDDRHLRLEALRRVRRVPKKSVVVMPHLLADYRRANLQRIAAEEIEDDARRNLLAAAGDAEQMECGDEGTATYLTHNRSYFDVQRFRKDHPELAAEYTGKRQQRRLIYKDP